MIRYSSSVHKSDWECSSKSVRGSLFVNPLYIKNLTNLTNLTTLQTLQPYRFLCRVPKGPHAYLCTLHKGRLPAPCELHEICSFSSLLRAFQSNWETELFVPLLDQACTVRGRSEIWNGNRGNRQK